MNKDLAQQLVKLAEQLVTASHSPEDTNKFLKRAAGELFSSQLMSDLEAVSNFSEVSDAKALASHVEDKLQECRTAIKEYLSNNPA